MDVDGARLLADLETLAAIGDTGDGGNCRLALTDEDAGGRELVVGWMRGLGLDVRIDRIGNVVGRHAGSDPSLAPVMTGSHIDTVRTGGRYDGTLGVLAGLEVCRALDGARRSTRRGIEVAFFTDEEGSRFAPDMLGSLTYAGGLDLEVALETVGFDGTILGDELERIGWAGDAAVPGPAPYAYVELHIEQGPVLEEAGRTIGAVTGVQGISWRELTLTGQSNHAGTTPLRLRHDAGVVAAEVVSAVRRIVRAAGEPAVGTVGRLSLHPDLVNVVAARATLTIDLRHTDGPTLHALDAAISDAVEAAAADEGAAAAWRTLAAFEPVVFDDHIVELVDTVARRHGHDPLRMPSGAGHDAQMLARMCPAGMVFVPSANGISHNPAEHTDDADLVAGLQVLADVVVELADS